MSLETTDADLMKALADGHMEALDQLILRHQTTLVNFLLHLGVQWDVAEDCAQEIWIKLYDYRHRYRPEAKLTTFLYLMARQKVMDHFRSQQRKKTWLEKIKFWQDAELERQERPTPEGDLSAALEAQLMNLSEEHREVLALRVIQELSYQEMAEILQVPLGTVKSRLHSALKQMKKGLLV
jgi:RNA polymerase sigma factor (sigma-70 family)